MLFVKVNDFFMLFMYKKCGFKSLIRKVYVFIELLFNNILIKVWFIGNS